MYAYKIKALKCLKFIGESKLALNSLIKFLDFVVTWLFNLICFGSFFTQNFELYPDIFTALWDLIQLRLLVASW